MHKALELIPSSANNKNDGDEEKEEEEEEMMVEMETEMIVKLIFTMCFRWGWHAF